MQPRQDQVPKDGSTLLNRHQHHLSLVLYLPAMKSARYKRRFFGIDFTSGDPFIALCVLATVDTPRF